MPIGLVAVVAAGVASLARADIDPLSGIDFVRIGAVGNQPYQSILPNDFVNGRGGVNYEYSIGRMEITTAQWTEFFNAAFDRPSDDRIPFLIPPDHWGAVATTPTVPGGQRWTVPAGNGLRPVGDISWRMAAIYCNWLCNNKGTDRSAFMNGAYDVSTFGFQGAIFTDQLAHNPEARYWIPTWDEWLKAAHYDPEKANADGTTGGWWQYSNGSDTPYTYGLPGVGQANSGFFSPSPYGIPLGSYPDVQSAWGLLDVAGATTEWTETVFDGRYRVFDGSYWTQDAFQSMLLDNTREWGGEFPHVPTLEFGLRLVSSVPSPGPWAVGVGVLTILGLRRSHRRGVRRRVGP